MTHVPPPESAPSSRTRVIQSQEKRLSTTKRSRQMHRVHGLRVERGAEAAAFDLVKGKHVDRAVVDLRDARLW